MKSPFDYTSQQRYRFIYKEKICISYPIIIKDYITSIMAMNRKRKSSIIIRKCLNKSIINTKADHPKRLFAKIATYTQPIEYHNEYFHTKNMLWNYYKRRDAKLWDK